MKRSMIAGLSLLSLLAIATPVAAVVGHSSPQTPEEAVELDTRILNRSNN
jgi:hypothetical protein